jgi:hypothetical protein
MAADRTMQDFNEALVRVLWPDTTIANASARTSPFDLLYHRRLLIRRQHAALI